jgi:hypothetical protein
MLLLSSDEPAPLWWVFREKSAGHRIVLYPSRQAGLRVIRGTGLPTCRTFDDAAENDRRVVVLGVDQRSIHRLPTGGVPTCPTAQESRGFVRQALGVVSLQVADMPQSVTMIGQLPEAVEPKN